VTFATEVASAIICGANPAVLIVKKTNLKSNRIQGLPHVSATGAEKPYWPEFAKLGSNAYLVE